MVIDINYSLKEFQQSANEAEVLAFVETISFDAETAISLAERFLDHEYFFLLESATSGPGDMARYSFVGAERLWSFELSNNQITEGFDKLRTYPTRSENPLKSLENSFGRLGLSVVRNKEGQLNEGADFCFRGGIVGYCGYEVAGYCEPTIGDFPRDKFADFPECFYFIPRNLLILDHLSRKLTIIRYLSIESHLRHDKDYLISKYTSEVEAFSKLLASVSVPRVSACLLTTKMPIDYCRFEQTIPETMFVDAVDRCLKEIRNGEIFQIQIGNRLSCRTDARPFDIFRHLRILNPSPYMVFYRLKGHYIICASPEMMVNVEKNRVLHRPIAGTRKRTWNLERDRMICDELQSNEKEIAEHIMLVDLSRNDVGRIAVPGTVKVEELMSVEGYSHVFHLVSQVSGCLRDDLTSFDALIASFPNGTVTGAPKVRAMQIINSIEPWSRQFYAGCLGIFDFGGGLKSTILIRTIHVGEGVASTQASAGIVYDSVPRNEWKETRNKMAACLVAMQNTQVQE